MRRLSEIDSRRKERRRIAPEDPRPRLSNRLELRQLDVVTSEDLKSENKDPLLPLDFRLVEVGVDGAEEVREEADRSAEGVGVGEPSLQTDGGSAGVKEERERKGTDVVLRCQDFEVESDHLLSTRETALLAVLMLEHERPMQTKDAEVSACRKKASASALDEEEGEKSTHSRCRRVAASQPQRS